MNPTDDTPPAAGSDDEPREHRRAQRKWRFSLFKPGLLAGKLILILAVVFFLNIGVGMVEDLVYEREGRYDQVSREVGSLWGSQQTLAGPVLAVPYGVSGDRPGPEHATERGTLYLLPEALDITSDLQPETRHRGIFEAVVYTNHASVSGHFATPSQASLQALDALAGDDVVLLWKKAFVAFGVPDMRSIRKVVEVRLNGQPRAFEPGTRMRSVLESGMSADVPYEAANRAGNDSSDGEQTLSFEFELRLNGSHSLSFMPLGRETHVTMSSPWPAPSFVGAFLPESHEIADDGFRATWTLSHFGRDYPQMLDSNALPEHIDADMQSSAFGVKLHQPVTTYRKVQRAIKYGILFLVFTFGFYFLVEIIAKRRIHPFQYALVGAPLCLFYLLLVAFAEHIGFDTAYVTGAACVISLVGLYSLKILASARRALVISALLGGLYAYLYVLLQQESYSLLGGATGLLVLTAALMYATRNVNWYASNGSTDSRQPQRAPA
ncbi:MAG: cell envelope integrity protein CreD [Gammaproteobacteria bacterium]